MDLKQSGGILSIKFQKMVKIITGLLIMCFITQCTSTHEVQNRLSGDIDQYIELSAVPIGDTIAVGDTLLLNVTFKNKTDSLISFYPDAGLMTLLIVRDHPVFDGPLSSYFLDTIVDARKPSKVQPLGYYKKEYKIPISFHTPDDNRWSDNHFLKIPIYRSIKKPKKDSITVSKPSIFSKGESVFYVTYNIRGGRDILYGHLVSNKFEIFVKSQNH